MNKHWIRDAIPTDAEGIATVHVTTWQSAYIELLPDFFLQSLSVEKRTASWSNIIGNPPHKSHVLVAMQGEQIVGFISLGPNRDSGSIDQGEIFAIYVDPKNQGKGIGSDLMKAGILRLKDEHFVSATLWVLKGNSPTRAWYESHGWRADGETKQDQRGELILDEVRYGIDL